MCGPRHELQVIVQQAYGVCGAKVRRSWWRNWLCGGGGGGWYVI
jgi:hypothetical protein